ncbi:MAG: biopolymer transporter ExbD [Verrucomicrobiales bacterium]|nr:biopolymer transporter ExbD [Verrucomicrobiales bacterium]HRE83777.1 biopolymer transporter ExbD [Opitutaceae bacterium]
MKFYLKRRRSPSVPIVTLIDILAILLIFFIVTTTFKTKESLVQVNLPRSSEMGEGTTAETRVSLALAKDGSISLGDRLVPLESLSAALEEFRASRPKDRLELKADEGAPLGLMVKVWDAASQAGLKIDDLPLRILIEE